MIEKDTRKLLRIANHMLSECNSSSLDEDSSLSYSLFFMLVQFPHLTEKNPELAKFKETIEKKDREMGEEIFNIPPLK